MTMFGGDGDSWRQEHDRRDAERQYEAFNLQSQAANARWMQGECTGCGAPWATHPLQNALAPAVCECAWCRRPGR